MFINKDAPQFVLRENDEDDQIISKDSKEESQTLLNQQNIEIGNLSQASISSEYKLLYSEDNIITEAAVIYPWLKKIKVASL